MTTANDLIIGGLGKAQILGAGRNATDEELLDGLVLMNDTFSELEESILSLGFQPVANGDDEVRIPRGAVGFAKGFLAMKMVNEYRVPMPLGLPNEVETSMNNVMIANRQPIATSYPSTLPIGSGNDGDVIRDDKFNSGGDKVNY